MRSRYQDNNKYKGTDKELSGVYETYAMLLVGRFGKTKDKNYLDAAINVFTKSITLDPNVWVTYMNRGRA